MAKKSKSKPMKEILERISLFKYITVVVFEEDVILNEPVENWPLCDCLISFHSKGIKEWGGNSLYRLIINLIHINCRILDKTGE